MIFIKRNLFLVFTPYHIKVSNYFAKELKKDEDNRIIVSSFTGIAEENLKKYIDTRSFKELKYFKLLYTLKEIVSNNITIRREIKQFVNYCKRVNPDEVIIFSDQPALYQEIIFELKNINSKLKVSLIEEGLALYVEDENKREVRKRKLFNFLYCKLLGIKRYKYIQHGKADFINQIYAREPKLISGDFIKNKINSYMLKEIVEFEYKQIEEIKAEEYSLLVPCSSWYNNDIRLKIFERIFSWYKEKKQALVLNLHPAEEYFDDILKLANEYNPEVIVLPRGKYVSEDLLGDMRIKELISDYSSTLINGIYLRDDIVAITYLNVLVNDYDIREFPSISIFEYLLEVNKIKKINLK